MNDFIQVNPVINHDVRHLCFRPYELHPKGCPNYGKRETCPPKAKLFDDVYDLGSPVYAIVNEFNIGDHIQKMKQAHPDWSDRQLRCVLYWQGGARKKLKEKIKDMSAKYEFQRHGYEIISCPEAMGVNVTATMEDVGIKLEWPPMEVARQICLVAIRKAQP